MQSRRGRSARVGFSLVEILIAVMILGIGLAMVAGAFPVGLRYFSDSADETIAGLLARSTLSTLQAMQTHQYEGGSGGSSDVRAEPYAQAAAVECFRTDTDEVVYLWDAAVHNGNAGRPGELLKDQGLGQTIDDWFPPSERICGVDPRFGCQVFYQKIGRLLAGGSAGPTAYVAFVVVQKTPVTEGSSKEWSDLFPAPSAEVTLSASGSTTVTWPTGAPAVQPGAMLVDVVHGEWASVVSVSGGQVTLNRALPGTRVRAVNYAVAMFQGIVSKEAIR